MPDICHRVGIAVAPERVYESLATTEGLAQWWTQRVEGDSVAGGTVRFYFGGDEPGAVMRVSELIPAQRVSWDCVAGAEEWIGTRLTFDLKPTGADTAVLFTHAGWREPVEFMYHCSTKWANFLQSLKAGLEDAAFAPFPNDPPISSWG
jgi:uncharacterized protein YndB with AHSA1/START domain